MQKVSLTGDERVLSRFKRRFYFPRYFNVFKACYCSENKPVLVSYWKRALLLTWLRGQRGKEASRRAFHHQRLQQQQQQQLSAQQTAGVQVSRLFCTGFCVSDQLTGSQLFTPSPYSDDVEVLCPETMSPSGLMTRFKWQASVYKNNTSQNLWFSQSTGVTGSAVYQHSKRWQKYERNEWIKNIPNCIVPTNRVFSESRG